jgi:hypothetical protein
MNELKEETSHRKDRLKEIANFLQSDLDDGKSNDTIDSLKIKNSILEEAQLNLIHSSLQSSAELRLALSNKLSVVDNNEAILHRLDNYQLIMNTLNSPEKDWTNEITDELIAKLESMVTIFQLKILCLKIYFTEKCRKYSCRPSKTIRSSDS